MQTLTGPGPGVLPSPVRWEPVLSGATLGKPGCEVRVSGVPVLPSVGLAYSSMPDDGVAAGLQTRSSESLQGHLLAVFLQPSEAHL